MSWGTEAQLHAMLRHSHIRIQEEARNPSRYVVPGDNAWSLILPFPPSLNHTYNPSPTKGLRLSEAGLAYKKEVGQLVMTQRRGREPLTGRLRLWVELHAPDHRRRDLSNFAFKLVEDALTEALVWNDDSQLDDIRATRGSVSTPGYLAVLIDRMSP